MKLRDYQQDAVDAVLRHFRQTDEAAVIVLPTGAGKSLVIAELARLARYPILVLAHVKELVEQNQAKFQALGFESGIFAAGLGRKESGQPVTFASIQSLSRNLEQFTGFYSLVIIDECHRVSDDSDSQYLKVIDHLKQINPQLKVLGLTATPYRLDKGWIYQQHYHGFVRTEQATPFRRCIFELPLRQLIRRKFLTPPLMIDAPAARYQWGGLPTAYTEADLDAYLAKSPRITQAICQHIVELAKSRQGVMVFASTVAHAQEIAGQLPDGETALITGATALKERDALIAQFKQRQLKYLVNVAVLTTGFDAPHVDFIAILRRTESVSLYQQIVGRGLRLADGKEDCLVVDYAGNGYDLHQPEIGSVKPNPHSELVQVPCPSCGFSNLFWGLTDADGDIVEHHGRRCQGLVDTEEGQQQCQFRFQFKQCGHCNAENDIAARQCHQCGEILIDPDDKLRQALNLNDRMVIRCAGMSATTDGDILRLSYHDEDGAELSERFDWSSDKQRRVFLNEFRRSHSGQPLPSKCLKQVANSIHLRVAPDFVIARQVRKHWRVEYRIFDYAGPYRKANQLS
ncbi:DEAD/DEAH box helicase [Neiella sp. HB171785]|uniref:DEAD/DEAH box helicase n=1 Tax=Neiella litorisoli TaxID=2771431 RepID=A0A8J6QTZ7_9GAMM|nr:DEAD/DEAH box helicase [Neiella litorisoli]MBD1389317.1 DEAD/DEAH box helicase [Neiella litorisoli]